MDSNFLQVKTEKEKNEDNKKWYKDWMDFILSRYNTQTYRNNYGGVGGSSSPSTGVHSMDSDADGFATSPIERIRRNYSYFSNTQDNKQFGFTTTDTDNLPLPYGQAWQRVPKTQQLIKDLIGGTLKAMKHQDLYAQSISPSAQNEKTNLLGLTRLKVDNKELYDDLNELGLSFTPLGGVEDEFETIDEVESFINNDYKTPVEVYGEVIKEEIIARNHYMDYYNEVLKAATIGGITATEIVVKNGKTYWETYEPDKIIWDNSKDKQHHRDFRFIGLIEEKTPTEILDIYSDELSEEEIKELSELTNSKTVSTSRELSLFGESNNIPVVTVVKGYWMAIKKDGDETYATYYKAVQIADIATVGQGLVENLVENFDDRRIVYPPVVLWTPDMVNGSLNSFTGRMIHNQDLIDFYKNEMNTKILLSHGKVALVMAENLGSSTMMDIVNDWKRYGLSVINNADGDDIESLGNKFAQVFDFSNSQIIQSLDALLKNEERMMEEITSANEITMGQQRNYISQGAQQTTIEQAKKGVFGFFEGFLNMVESLVQMSVNIEKSLIPVNNEKYAIPIVSKFGENFLEKIKEISLEDLRIRFKYLDPITEDKMNRIMNYIEREASIPNSLITPEDFANALSFKTTTQLQKYFKKITKRGEKQKERALEAQMLQAEQEQMAKGESNMAVASISADASRDVAETKAEADLLATAMKQGQ